MVDLREPAGDPRELVGGSASGLRRPAGDPRRPVTDGPLRLAVLGSTGSIGRQALDVARVYPEYIEVVALAAGSNAELLLQQAAEFGVRHLALAKKPEQLPAIIRSAGLSEAAAIAYGPEAVVALTELNEVDCVLNAMVGSAGLLSSYHALRAGKRLALANKESLVVGGELLMPLAAAGQLVPVDSEHSAIYQCLTGEPAESVATLILTASGGPFRNFTRQQLANVQVSEALAHPNWSMGAKISIDSATMMNKGLEVIEAMHLFNMPLQCIEIVVHPQSVVHSMVCFSDGSIKAQLGPADMRIPIQYALSCPSRWSAVAEPLSVAKLSELTFAEVDTEVFGCLGLALQAAGVGGTAPAILNAANEEAVAAFLAGQIGFLDIERCVLATLESLSAEAVVSLEQLLDIDLAARRVALQAINSLAC